MLVSDLQLLTLGRVNFDLYAQQHGVPFSDVQGWDAMVGGSPTNVALAAARLQVRAGVLTAIGQDLVGSWVLRSLERQGVNTQFVARKPGVHTSLALRAQLPPDHPLAFYRHDPADIHLTDEDLIAAPVDTVPTLLVSADALARGTTRNAASRAVRRARAGDRTTIYLDLDFRETNWADGLGYASTVGPIVDDVHVVIGTEEEFAVLLGRDEPGGTDHITDAVDRRLSPSREHVLLIKRGAQGARILDGESQIDVPAFPVTEASSVGAGDSFAAGLIAARLNSSDWAESGRFAAACAAITVSRFGCSTGFPYLSETASFLRAHAPLAIQDTP